MGIVAMWLFLCVNKKKVADMLIAHDSKLTNDLTAHDSKIANEINAHVSEMKITLVSLRNLLR